MDNKYSVYRKIRYDRTYRTLGKMNWVRVVLGTLLLISLLFISGTASKPFASRGQFSIAQKLMIWPWWVETYKPDTKTYIDAGVLFEHGEYEEAQALLAVIEDADAAALKAECAVKLAAEKLNAGDYAEACDTLMSADASALTEQGGSEYMSLCETLYAHFSGNDKIRAAKLSSVMEAKS